MNIKSCLNFARKLDTFSDWSGFCVNTYLTSPQTVEILPSSDETGWCGCEGLPVG